MYTVVKENKALASAYQNVTYGRPDPWDVVSKHRLLKRAKAAAKRLAKTSRCQVRDDNGHVLAWGCDL